MRLKTIKDWRQFAEFYLCPNCKIINKTYFEPAISDLLSKPIDDWREVESDITQMVLITGLYLFSWDKIQGIDDREFLNFLKKYFSIDGGKNAKIEKTDDGKTIQLSISKKFISLTLNDEETKANLEIDNVKTAEYNVKKENDKLKIYKKVFKGNNDFLVFSKDLRFKWDEKDEWELIKFLQHNYSIDWIKIAEIKRDEYTIELSTENNNLSLTLNDEKKRVSLKLDDGTTDELIVKTQNGDKIIFKESSNVVFDEEIDMDAFQKIKGWGFQQKIKDLYEKGILRDFSRRFLHEAYDVRNTIHDPSIVSRFSEKDYILFHKASLVTYKILEAIQIERGEDISTSHKSRSTNLKNEAEELAKQCLL